MNCFFYPIKLLLLFAMVQPVVANEATNLDSAKQLVMAVLQANPRLEVAQATWQASVAKVEQQAAFDDPQFQYSFAPLTVNAQKADFGQRFQPSEWSQRKWSNDHYQSGSLG